LPHHLRDLLVNLVDIGALLAVNLDVDKALVHQARDV
jgi:hypothetical protein